MCFYLPGPATSEHNVPTAVIIQSPVRSHHGGASVVTLMQYPSAAHRQLRPEKPHSSTVMEFLADKEPAQYTFEIRCLNMRHSDFWTSWVIPKWQKMECVAYVKMKVIQKDRPQECGY